ncbi:MAG: 2-dehydropantoate 2-reductase [Deltaproteobacteria bacterium]|nr:2-dehydropantoate 2-reductase [Deltaproteobacteria bacterium]
MKIAVLGAGAMGCLYGAKLWESGQKVVLLDVREDHVRAVNEAGLFVESEEGERKVAVPASLPGDWRAVPDLLLVFTKAFHTAAALEGARHLLGPETWLLSLQNGLGHAELLSKFADPSRIIVGTTTIPSDLVGPGRIRSLGSGATRIMTADGVVSERLRSIAEAFERAGLNCQVAETVAAVIWEKASFNAAVNCLAAVTRLPVGGVGRTPEGRALAFRIVAEAMEVARRKGLPVNEQAVLQTVEMAFREHGEHKPSMLQDVLAGRPTEVEFINGAIVREAKALGLQVPVTETLYGLVRTLERSYG